MRLYKTRKALTPPASLFWAKLVGVTLFFMLAGCPASPSTPAPAPIPSAAPMPAPPPIVAPAPVVAPVPAPVPAPAAAGKVTVATKSLRSCEDVRAAYKALLTAAEHTRCGADAECQTLRGECALGLGGCYQAANQAVTQDSVRALGTRFEELGCSGPVCRCTRPPPAHCAQGSCTLP